MTLDEAEAIGDLSMEGYWLEGDGPLQDVGQIELILWWD